MYLIKKIKNKWILNSIKIDIQRLESPIFVIFAYYKGQFSKKKFPIK